MTRKNHHRGKHSGQDQSKGPQRGQGGGAYWVFGKHAVTAALGNPERRIARLWLSRDPEGELAAAIAKSGKPAQRVEGKQMESIVPEGVPHQGIAAEIYPLEAQCLNDLGTNAKRLVVLDQVTDPHNVGAILRSCAAFGVDGLILTRDNSPPETASLAKAASGALEIVPLIKVTNLASTLKELKDDGFWVLGLDGEGTMSLHDAPAYDKVVLVLGAEGDGMRRLTRELCDLIVKLPMSGRIESLNVSNAAAIALYEISRVPAKK